METEETIENSYSSKDDVKERFSARKYDDADQRPDKGEIPVYTPSLLHKFKAEKRDHLNSTTKKWMHAVSHWSSEGSRQRNIHSP